MINLPTNHLLSLTLDGEASYNTGAVFQVFVNVSTHYGLVGVSLPTILIIRFDLSLPFSLVSEREK